MKTFIILFLIAVSLPGNAQRVQENVKQRVEVAEEAVVVPEEAVVDKAAVPSKGDIKKDEKAAKK